MKKLISISLLCWASCSAQAHIVLDVQSAPVGSYYRGALRVGHGCEGSPVKQIIVFIPDGVQGAKPMPKPGWRVAIERKTLAKPYDSHGRTVTEDVSEITWTAQSPDNYLQNAHYDEFVVFAKLPDTAGKLYWKTSQICEQGRVDWSEIPVPGSLTKLKSPAALLEVQPKVEVHDHGKHEHHKH